MPLTPDNTLCRGGAVAFQMSCSCGAHKYLLPAPLWVSAINTADGFQISCRTCNGMLSSATKPCFVVAAYLEVGCCLQVMWVARIVIVSEHHWRLQHLCPVPLLVGCKDTPRVQQLPGPAGVLALRVLLQVWDGHRLLLQLGSLAGETRPAPPLCKLCRHGITLASAICDMNVLPHAAARWLSPATGDTRPPGHIKSCYRPKRPSNVGCMHYSWQLQANPNVISCVVHTRSGSQHSCPNNWAPACGCLVDEFTSAEWQLTDICFLLLLLLARPGSLECLQQLLPQVRSLLHSSVELQAGSSPGDVVGADAGRSAICSC